MNFDKHRDRMFKLAFVGIITMWIVTLGILGAVGYVVYKLLIHFNIL